MAKLPKTRRKTKREGGRFELKNKIRAKQAARRQNTNLIKKGGVPVRKPFESFVGQAETAESLKNGVLGMGERLGATQEQWDALQAMDPENLADWYSVNPTAFEVYWSYEDVTSHGSYYTVSENKKTDLDFFIDEYHRLFEA